jgi:hypothetical protein
MIVLKVAMAGLLPADASEIVMVIFWCGGMELLEVVASTVTW